MLAKDSLKNANLCLGLPRIPERDGERASDGGKLAKISRNVVHPPAGTPTQKLSPGSLVCYYNYEFFMGGGELGSINLGKINM